MNRHPKLFAFWIWALLMACALPALSARPELTAAQEKFTNYMSALAIKHDADMADWARDYRDSLEAFVQRSQQEGNLEALMGGKEEVARFAGAPVLTPRMALGMKGGLKAIFDEYSARAETTLRTYNESLISLFQSYSGSLERLESQFTSEGSIDAAVEVRQARKTCLDDDILRRARFEMAAAGVNASGGAEVVARPAFVEPRPDREVAPPIRTDEMAPQPSMTTVHGVTVYSSGAPARENGLLYKRTTLTRTPAAPIRSPWSVSGLTAREETSTPGESYLTKVLGCRLRISVKALLGQDGVQNIMVVTQYYTTPAEARGSIVPRLTKTRRTPLSLGAGGSALLEYPSFDVWTARAPGFGVYGEEFYGVVITIFNADGEIEYQAASARGLEAVAATSMPGATPEEDRTAMMAEIEAAARDIVAMETVMQSKGEWSALDRMRVREAKWRLDQLRESFERLQGQE